jgi:hypothetical protein
MTKKQKLETRNSPPAPASGCGLLAGQPKPPPSQPSGKKPEAWQIFAREATVGVNLERLKDLVRPPLYPFPRARGAWRVARGAWRVWRVWRVRSYIIPPLSTDSKIFL